MMKTKHSALLMAGLLTVGAILSGCTDTETAVSDPMNRMTNAGPGVGSSESGWTIMVYLCGSDLESSGGLASLNLEEMCSAVLPEDVNVLVETGGTSTWYWDGIETDVLGRYQVMDGSLEEAETVELASMGDPSTLTGFIQWGIETYPSEHYGLILWDHGGGNADGVCYDELYDGDNLTLPELGSALNDTGVTLDFIGFDACLMASFETAKVISGFGYYMVASEETEPGQGWDYESMLNAIGEDPSMQGDALGKVICDAFLDKCLRLDCADEATLSVIDLSAVDMLDRTFDEYTSGMAMAADDVEALNSVASAADQTESYGGNTDAEGYCNMVDVADLVSNTQDYVQTDGSGLLRAIDEAVVYSVHGDSRENSHGISVFYPIEVTEDELSVYIQNSDNTPYLQYIAAVTDTYGDVDWDQEWADYDSSVWWSSSEEDVQELLTDMQPVSGSNFDVQYEQTSGDDGYLHLSSTSGLEAVKSVHFLLWYMTDGSEDGSASEFVYLGEDNNIDSDWENGRFKDNFFGQWMTIGGEYVNAELIEETESYNRYSIPAEVNGKETNIRAIYDYSTETYRVLGTYDGVESSDGIGSMTSRGITPLQEGDEIVFLLPAFQADSEEENWYYTDAVEWSDDIIMEDEDMGDGYYMYMFEITDIFGVEYDTEPVIMQVEGDTVYQIAE